MAPLERHKRKIVVLSGLNMQDVGVGAPHTKGMPLIWTRMSYTDARQPLQPATDPWMQFERLFAALAGDEDRARS